jgi:hypothetical protein
MSHPLGGHPISHGCPLWYSSSVIGGWRNDVLPHARPLLPWALNPLTLVSVFFNVVPEVTPAAKRCGGNRVETSSVRKDGGGLLQIAAQVSRNPSGRDTIMKEFVQSKILGSIILTSLLSIVGFGPILHFHSQILCTNNQLRII